ncbi:37S ribosomal protein-like protein Mrp17 [Microthyrium microscopicum]|uniref:Small ribosomal subunit protein bS6m n=1 Tax=Microthyrium microscopicum TaxID=703497 RepID=A0A6A6U715_9PEZI|nr:37S ribosomal protein-like protein Mrp17 [Microthyrium microscopicum]
MLYELISVVRPGSIREAKDIARTAGTIILQRGGVVRGLTNWGVFALPKPMRASAGAQKHHAGQYFIMRFDASAKAQDTMKAMLKMEPRLLRFSVVKLGHTLKHISNVGGQAEEWSWQEGSRGSKWVSEVDEATPQGRNEGLGFDK